MAKSLDMQSAHYEQLKATAAADLPAGNLVTVNDAYVFPLVDVTSGEEYTGITKSEKVKAAKVVGAINPGQAIYWVNASNNVGAAGDILIGHANEAALSADTHVSINFNGMLAFAKLEGR